VAIYRGHKDGVTSAIFSPDEKQILTTSRDGTARLWHPDGLPSVTLTYPMRNESTSNFRIEGVFTPDGCYILVCNEDEAWLWDIGGNIQPTNWDARPKLDEYIETWMQGPSRYDPRERAKSEGHIERIYSAVFSPDGQRVLTASEDETARIWDLSGHQLAILRGHEGQVIRAIFSPPDGRLILTGSIDKTARLWSADGELLATLKGHTADVGHLAFSPDGKLMLTAVDGGGTRDSVVRLWDRSGKLLATLEGHNDNELIRGIAFSPDGQRIVTASDDGTTRLWDLEGRTLAVFRGHLGIIWDVTFSPNGRSVLTASKDKTARLWESTQSLLPTIEGYRNIVTTAVYNSNETYILTSSTDGTTCLWDTGGHRRATYQGVAKLMADNVLSPDGRYLLTTQQENGQVHLWRLPPNVQGFTSSAQDDGSNGLAGDVTRLEVQPDVGTSELDAPLVTLIVLEATGGSREIRKAVFSTDARRILVLTEESARLWDRQGKLVAALEGPNLNPREKLAVNYAMFSPDSQRILSGSINGTVWVWTMDGQLVASFLTDSKSAWDNLFSVTFSPDGQRILTTIRQSADLWDTDGYHLTKLPCNTNKVKRGLFSPKGDRIVTMAEAAIPDVRLWDSDGRLITSLSATGGEFAPILFDREGKHLCIVDQNVIKLWDRDGHPFATLVTDRGTWIKHLAFSPDGDHLLTASTNGKTQLWTTRDGGRLQATFKGHTAEVNSAIFSPSGKRVLTASSDGTARQFLTQVEDLISCAARRVGRDLNDEEIARFNVPTPVHTR
jgi:WD40 repeat protein